MPTREKNINLNTCTVRMVAGNENIIVLSLDSFRFKLYCFFSKFYTVTYDLAHTVAYGRTMTFFKNFLSIKNNFYLIYIITLT